MRPSFCQEALVIFGFSLKSETFPSCGLELMVLNTWWAFRAYILNAFLLEFFPGLDSYMWVRSPILVPSFMYVTYSCSKNTYTFSEILCLFFSLYFNFLFISSMFLNLFLNQVDFPLDTLSFSLFLYTFLFIKIISWFWLSFAHIPISCPISSRFHICGVLLYLQIIVNGICFMLKCYA